LNRVAVQANHVASSFSLLRIVSDTMTSMRSLSGSPVQAIQPNLLKAAAASSISSGIIIPSIIRIHMGAGM
jgi:hypothetical protein